MPVEEEVQMMGLLSQNLNTTIHPLFNGSSDSVTSDYIDSHLHIHLELDALKLGTAGKGKCHFLSPKGNVTGLRMLHLAADSSPSL